MNISQEILSNIVVYNKYSKYLPKKQRRETWDEIVTRNKKMHLSKFPDLKEEIEEVYKLVYNKKVLPSMRSLQFAGKPIDINNSRIFNFLHQVCTPVAALCKLSCFVHLPLIYQCPHLRNLFFCI